MPVFQYQALHKSGKNVKGQVDAESMKQAKDKLKADKLFPTEIVELKGVSSVQDVESGESFVQQLVSTFTGFFSRVSTRELSLLTRQLAVLLRAGIPLVDSLTALIEQIEKEQFQQVLSQVRDNVNEGASLADSLAQHPRMFSNLYVNMVRAGESSGTMELVLARLADFLDGQAALKQKVTSALAYPMMIILVMIGAIVFLVNFVIPKMLSVFEQSEMELPLQTRILLAIVDITQNWWWAILLAIIVAVTALVRYNRTEKGKKKIDALKLRIPGIKRLVLYISIARFSRTLGTLLKSGVNMITSLRIVQAVLDNEVMKKIVADTEEAVVEGASLMQPLKASGVFPPTVVHMVSAGEKSGELEDMLLRVAETYEEQVESYVVILTSWLEPVIIIAMTVAVGFIVVSILMPMLEMNTVL